MGDREWQVVGRRRRNSRQINVKRGSSTHCSASREPPHCSGYAADHNSNIDPSTRIADNGCDDVELRDKADMDEHIDKQARLVRQLQGLLKQTVIWECLRRELQTALSCVRLNFSSTSEEYPSLTQVEHSQQTHSQVCLGESLSPTSKIAGMDDRRLFLSSNGSFPTHSSVVRSTSGPKSQELHSQEGFMGRKSKSSNSTMSHPHSERCKESDNCSANDIGELPEGHKGFSEIVCYGIGPFGKEMQPKYQLALAVCLRELLFPHIREPAEECNDHGKEGPYGIKPVRPKLLVFDPILGGIEKAILAKLGCGVIETNEKGKRCCCTPSRPDDARPTMLHCRPTLFFMPHCPRPLYSNVLWANWSVRGALDLRASGPEILGGFDIAKLSLRTVLWDCRRLTYFGGTVLRLSHDAIPQ